MNIRSYVTTEKHPELKENVIIEYSDYTGLFVIGDEKRLDGANMMISTMSLMVWFDLGYIKENK